MRSHFVVSLGEEDAAGKVRRWLVQFFVAEHSVPFVLNVAGPQHLGILWKICMFNNI